MSKMSLDYKAADETGGAVEVKKLQLNAAIVGTYRQQ